jgi:tRNA G18 (ribose-2'-O)-methylase SpoU
VARAPSPANNNDKVSVAHTPNRFGKGTASAVLKAIAEGLWLAVESIDSPGNLGTIIRTAEAVGVTGIFLPGRTMTPGTPPPSAPAWDRCFRKSW